MPRFESPHKIFFAVETTTGCEDVVIYYRENPSFRVGFFTDGQFKMGSTLSHSIDIEYLKDLYLFCKELDKYFPQTQLPDIPISEVEDFEPQSSSMTYFDNDDEQDD